MKLIYLWIENYQHIRQQGYLLHSGYHVKYDRKENHLSISEKPNIDCLLYGEKISVMAIVGDNGAGKSTLLDAIRIVLFDSDSRGKEIQGFLVWEEEGKLQVLFFMEEEKQPGLGQGLAMNKWLPDDLKLIYYSDFLDEKYYHGEFDDGEDGYTYIDEQRYAFQNRSSVQVNISTSYLLRVNGSVQDFFHGDTKRQLYFYGNLSETSRLLPFPSPAGLSVKLEFLKIDIFDRVLDASLQAYEVGYYALHGEINTVAFVISLLKDMEVAYHRKTVPNMEPIGAVQILQWDIFVEYLYNLLTVRKQDHAEIHDYDQVDGIIEKVVSNDTNEDTIWEELGKIFSGESTEESFQEYLDFYHKTMEMLEHPKNGNFCVECSIPEEMIQILRDHDPIPYILSISKEAPGTDWEGIRNRFPEAYMRKNGWSGNWDKDMFLEFYDSYVGICDEIDFLKCSWGMSSGENCLFSLYARLYEAMQRKEKASVVLIFDELDSSFHPQWQQKILDYLTKFLRYHYPQKEFQLILTTHSPVLLSDIPRENVIFMSKGDSAGAEHGQTFAANISSLYYDSFFMEKGSIGEVARRSIIHLMEAITELEEEEEKKGVLEGDRGYRLYNRFLRKQYPDMQGYIAGYERGDEALIQTMVDNIGEDIWRYKANQRLHHFLQDEKVDRKKEIWSRLRALEEEEGRGSVMELFEQWRKEDDSH